MFGTTHCSREPSPAKRPSMVSTSQFLQQDFTKRPNTQSDRRNISLRIRFTSSEALTTNKRSQTPFNQYIGSPSNLNDSKMFIDRPATSYHIDNSQMNSKITSQQNQYLNRNPDSRDRQKRVFGKYIDIGITSQSMILRDGNQEPRTSAVKHLFDTKGELQQKQELIDQLKIEIKEHKGVNKKVMDKLYFIENRSDFLDPSVDLYLFDFQTALEIEWNKIIDQKTGWQKKKVFNMPSKIQDIYTRLAEQQVTECKDKYVTMNNKLRTKMTEENEVLIEENSRMNGMKFMQQNQKGIKEQYEQIINELRQTIRNQKQTIGQHDQEILRVNTKLKKVKQQRDSRVEDWGKIQETLKENEKLVSKYKIKKQILNQKYQNVDIDDMHRTIQQLNTQIEINQGQFHQQLQQERRHVKQLQNALAISKSSQGESTPSVISPSKRLKENKTTVSISQKLNRNIGTISFEMNKDMDSIKEEALSDQTSDIHAVIEESVDELNEALKQREEDEKVKEGIRGDFEGRLKEEIKLLETQFQINWLFI